MCSLVTCVGNTLLTFAAGGQLITMHLRGSEILPLSIHYCLSVLPPLPPGELWSPLLATNRMGWGGGDVK